MQERTQTEKEIIKNQAITDLFDSDIIQKKIKYYCFKNKISLTTDIHHDITQVVFLELSRKPADYIIEMIEDTKKKNRMVGLAVCIAVRKGFLRHPKGYPKHSLSQEILFGSTLKEKNVSINTAEALNEDEKKHDEVSLQLHEENIQPIDELFKDIRDELTLLENKQMERWLSAQKKNQPPTQHLTRTTQKLFERIKQIVISKKIKNLK